MPAPLHRVFLDVDGTLRNGWKVLGYFLLVAAVSLVLSPLYRLLPRPIRAAFPGQWVGALACLAAAWAFLRTEAAPLSALGLRLNGRFLGHLVLGTLGGCALMGASAGLAWSLGGLHWTRTPGVGLAALSSAARLFLAVALFEELLFRGYAFQRAARGLGFAGAQAAFALLFALMHWRNPGMAGATKAWATMNIALAALLLGFCWRRTGSLALPIGVHLGWNWTQGSLLGFGVSGTASQGWWTPAFHGRPEWLTGGAFGLEASLPGALVCGAAVLALWVWKGAGEDATGGASTASGS